VIILSGVIFGLAKTGKLKMLADTIIPKSTTTTGNVRAQIKKDNQPTSAEVNLLRYINQSGEWNIDLTFPRQPKIAGQNGESLFPGVQVLTDNNLRYKIYASQVPNCSSESDLFNVVANQTIEKIINLSCAGEVGNGQIHGYVRDTSGNNLPNRNIILTFRDQNGQNQNRNIQTGAAGDYSFGVVPIGVVTLTVQGGSQYGDQSKTATVIANDVIFVNFNLETKTANLRFYIQDQNHTPLHGISIIRDGQEEKISNTTGEGQFNNLTLGQHQFLINSEGSGSYNSNYLKNVSAQYDVKKNADNFLEVTINPQTVSKLIIAGKVTDKDTGEFVGGEDFWVISRPIGVTGDTTWEQSYLSTSAIWPESAPIYNYKIEHSDFNSNNEFEVSFTEMSERYNISGDLKFTIEVGRGIQYNQTYSAYFAEVNFVLEKEPVAEIIVKDNQTKAPITGASVKLISRIDNFELSATTNSEGKAEFYKYRIKTLIDTKIDLEAQISASGYISRIILEISKNYPWTIFLNQKQAAGTFIVGTVKDINSNANIAGAKISLWKNTPTAPLQTTQSGSDGRFRIDNVTPGNYYLNAFHIDYLDTAKSRVYFNIKNNEAVEVVLSLKQKEQASREIRYPVLVLQSKSLKPLSGVTVKVIIGQEVQSGTTDDYGRYEFYPELGQTVTIRIEYKGAGGAIESREKKITLPANFDGLSEQEILQVFGYGIFIIPQDLPNQNNLAKLTVIVKNNQGQRLSNIKVLVGNNSATAFAGYYIAMPAYGEIYDPLSYKIFGLTGQDGKLVIPDGVRDSIIQGTLYENWKNTLADNFQIYLGDEFKVYAEDPSGQYQDQSKDIEINTRNQTIEITLKSKSEAGYCINVHTTDYFGSQNWPQSSIKLQQKQPNGSYQDIGRDADNWDDFLPDRVVNADILAKYCNLTTGYYRAYLPGANYYSQPVYFDNKEDKEIKIGWCPQNDLVVSLDNGIYFAFENQDTKDWFNTNIDFFRDLSQKIVRLKNQSKDVGNLIISIRKGDFNAAALSRDVPTCFGNSPSRIIVLFRDLIDWYIKIHRTEDLFTVVTHEYGHHVYQAKFLDPNTSFGRRWQQLFNQIVNDGNGSFRDCVWNQIKEGNVGILPYSLMGHPYDNPHEMFASFFSAYFTQHDRFYGIIRYHAGENSYCQNTLAYMWELFAENVGTVYGNDNLMFKPVGGRLGNANYTFEQIKRGHWRESVYNSLGLLQKAMVQFNRIIGPVANANNWAKAVLQQKINAFNNWLDNALKKLGLFNETGTITGTLVNESGQKLADYLIQIGPRVAITNSQGNFIIRRIPKGEQQIIRIRYQNQTNFQIIDPANKKVNVIKGESVNAQIKIKPR